MAELFGDTAIYASEKLAEVAREIGQRIRVYPRLIEAGKLTQPKADRQIAVMRAIERDYTTAAALDRPLVKARLATFTPGFRDDRCELRFDVEVTVAGQERPRLAECVVEVGGYELAAIIRERAADAGADERRRRRVEGRRPPERLGDAGSAGHWRGGVMEWNEDMSQAPRGDVRIVPWGDRGATRALPVREWLFALSRDGHVIRTFWLDDEQRWNGFEQKSPPIAWLRIPNHPAMQFAGEAE